MKQFYAKYTDWEDYQNGMYDSYDLNKKESLINESINLLTDLNKFYKTMNIIIKKWKISTKVNLTNLETNRKAWLGQAACCYNHNCPETLTRIAWSRLTTEQQIKANKTAQKIITEYERKNRKIHKSMASQGVLF